MWSASWKGTNARAVARATIQSLFQHIGLDIVNTNTICSYERQTFDLKEHNRLLVESSTQSELKLQQKEQELMSARIAISTLSPENERLRAEHAFYAKRAAELEEHNRLLTESATAAVRKLQNIHQTDYQIIMAQQQLLAGHERR